MGKLADAARAYKGVRFRHRGRSRNGLDCGGLGVLSYRDCGVEIKDFLLYGRTPHENGLIVRMTEALGEPLPISTPLQDDDVVVFRFVNEPHHIAIVGEADYGGVKALNIVHADGQCGRVIEQRLTPDMTARITHIFRRGVE